MASSPTRVPVAAKISANLSVENGSFYTGRKTTVTVARGRLALTSCACRTDVFV
jgi:hypothetical protein